MIKVSIDVRSAIKQMKDLKDNVQDKAIARSLNECVAKGRTVMSKEIRSEYRISADKVRERLSIRKAFVDGTFRFSAELKGGDGKKRAMNIIYFAEKGHILGPSLREARARRKAGTLGRVFVQVRKGGKAKALNAMSFIGNKGRTVFQRVGPNRLPIKPVRTINVPQMFNQKSINAAVTAVMKREFNVIFERNLRYYAAKASQ
jgi:hypothetical protein